MLSRLFETLWGKFESKDERLKFIRLAVIFGFTIVLFVVNNLLLSILNGLKEIKTWVMINIIQSIYYHIMTLILR